MELSQVQPAVERVIHAIREGQNITASTLDDGEILVFPEPEPLPAGDQLVIWVDHVGGRGGSTSVSVQRLTQYLARRLRLNDRPADSIPVAVDRPFLLEGYLRLTNASYQLTKQVSA